MNEQGVWPGFEQEASDCVLREDLEISEGGLEGSDLNRVRNGPYVTIQSW